MNCSSNLRTNDACDDQLLPVEQRKWPESTHTSEMDPVTLKYTRSWIYTVGPYLEEVDAIRLCPDDPLYQVRQLGKSTSYTMNGYLSKEARPAFDNLRKIRATSKSILLLELSENKEPKALATEDPTSSMSSPITCIHSTGLLTPSSKPEKSTRRFHKKSRSNAMRAMLITPMPTATSS
jgi:hypothetical protein